jgi:hypothetical protein
MHLTLNDATTFNRTTSGCFSELLPLKVPCVGFALVLELHLITLRIIEGSAL